MKIIKIEKKNLFKISAILAFAIIVLAISTAFGMQSYYKVDFSTGLVTATTLNVRSGPGTTYKVVATAKKNTEIRILNGRKSAVLEDVEKGEEINEQANK